MKQTILTILGLLLIGGFVYATETIVKDYQLEPKRYFTFNISTSTIDVDGNYVVESATSTVKVNAPSAMTINWLGCDANTGTAGLRCGDGTNWMSYIACDTTAATSSMASNNTFTALEDFRCEVNLSAENSVLTILSELTTD